MEEDFEDAIESEELVAAGSVRAVHHDVASPAQSRGTVGGCDDATHSELQSSTEALRLEMERRIVREAELEAANAELRAELARREQTIQEAASLVEQERRRADALESLADERAEAYLAERSGLLAERLPALRGARRGGLRKPRARAARDIERCARSGGRRAAAHILDLEAQHEAGADDVHLCARRGRRRVRLVRGEGRGVSD